jgi:hypothetical protein
MFQKGRQNKAQGSKHGSAKLNGEEVLQIRKLYATNKITQAALGEQFNVHQTTISDIVLRNKWIHL